MAATMRSKWHASTQPTIQNKETRKQQHNINHQKQKKKKTSVINITVISLDHSAAPALA